MKLSVAVISSSYNIAYWTAIYYYLSKAYISYIFHYLKNCILMTFIIDLLYTVNDCKNTLIILINTQKFMGHKPYMYVISGVKKVSHMFSAIQ